MSYPPPLPPDTRENDTPMADNHAGDHNAVVNAIEDVVGVIGNFPQGAYTSSIQDRLSWLEWRPGVNLKFSVPVAPDKIVLRCGAVDAVIVTDTSVQLNGIPLIVNGGTITSEGINVADIQCYGITASGVVTAAGFTTTSRVTAGDALLTGGPLYLPGGHRVEGGAGTVGLVNASGTVASLSATTLAVISNGVGVGWNERPLYVQAGYGAIGFHSTTLANAGAIQLFTSGVTTIGFHFVNGNNSAQVTCHAVDFIKPSARRTKSDIERWAGNGVAVCQQLVPVTFRSKLDDDGNLSPRQIGFIAEDVAEVVAEVVERGDDDMPRGLSYMGLIPILVDAICQLDDRLAGVEER